MFILWFFNFWGFGPVYDLSRVFNGKIRVIQETLISIDNDLEDGYLTTQ